jgi:hypothetical protein
MDTSLFQTSRTSAKGKNQQEGQKESAEELGGGGRKKGGRRRKIEKVEGNYALMLQ